MIDVIVPQWNQREKTITCLRSIAQHAPDARIILVDNGSAEDQRVERPRATDVLIRNDENLGFVRAVNQGFASSTADWVVIQNNDTEIFDDVFSRMRRILERESRYGALGPITSECGSWQAIDRLAGVWASSRRRAKLLRSGGARDVAGLRTVQACRDGSERAARAAELFGETVEPIRGMVAFFCVMLSGVAVENIGPLDTDYGVGFGDDDDYCDRLHDAGWQVGLAPGCYVRHDHRTTFREHFSEQQIGAMQRQAYVTLDRKRRERRARRARRPGA